MNYRDNKIFASLSLSSRLSSAALFTALALLVTQTAFAFPTGGGGCFFCSPYNLGGSTITFDLVSNDDNGLAPVTFNFLENTDDGDEAVVTGRLCLSGKIHATIVSGTETGEAIYDLLGSDGSNRGVCYENVTQDCVENVEANVGPSCTQDKCTYTVPPLAGDVSLLLDGRFKVDSDLTSTGPYAVCTPDSITGSVCNFEVGFGFDDGIPPNLFPATYNLNNEHVDANVVLHSTEVCIECSPEDLGLTSGTTALNSKSNKIRACEALAVKSDWCNDLQSPGDPNCIGNPTNPPRGGMNTAMGDFQIQDTTGEICVSDLEDLQTLLPGCETEVAIAACGDGPGFITFPESFKETTCQSSGADVEIFYYSSAEGGGTTMVNMAAIGAQPDAPGYAGDNTIPPVLPGWAAIISTPDNQNNEWTFVNADLVKIAFIHGRNGNDIITGSKGPDTILGGSGADELHGNDGNDVLQGGNNTDQLFGDNGDDLLLGYDCDGPNADCSSFSNNGGDDDYLNGGPGNDCSDGGSGNDTHDLEEGGSDAVVLFGNSDNDTIDGFTPGEYDPENPGEVDVIVDLTGTAKLDWVKGSKKDDLPSVCQITTSGNNTIILSGVEGDGPNGDCTTDEVNIIDPTNGDSFPAECAGHPYTFQQ
jgi:hypothetical protein